MPRRGLLPIFAITLLGSCARERPQALPASPPEAIAPPLAPAVRAAIPRPQAPVVDRRPDPVTLLPADAIALGGVDLHALTSSSAWTEARVVAGADAGEFFRLFDLSSRCGASIERLESMHAAVLPGATSEAMVIVRGDAIAEPAVVECIIDEVQRQRRSDGVAELPPPRHEVADGHEAYSFDDRGTRLHVLPSDDLVAIGPAHAEAAFMARLADRGRSTAPVELGVPVAGRAAGRRFDGRTAWFVAHPPAGASPVERATEIVGSLVVTSGVNLHVALDFGDANDADAAHGEIRDLFQALRSVATVIGIPSDALDRVRIERLDRRVEIDAAVTGDELRQWWNASHRGPSPDGDPTLVAPAPDSPLL